MHDETLSRATGLQVGTASGPSGPVVKTLKTVELVGPMKTRQGPSGLEEDIRKDKATGGGKVIHKDLRTRSAYFSSAMVLSAGLKQTKPRSSCALTERIENVNVSVTIALIVGVRKSKKKIC